MGQTKALMTTHQSANTWCSSVTLMQKLRTSSCALAVILLINAFPSLAAAQTSSGFDTTAAVTALTFAVNGAPVGVWNTTNLKLSSGVGFEVTSGPLTIDSGDLTVSTGNVWVNKGWISGVTPGGNNSTGGVRVKDSPGSPGSSILQFTDNVFGAQYGVIVGQKVSLGGNNYATGIAVAGINYFTVNSNMGINVSPTAGTYAYTLDVGTGTIHAGAYYHGSDARLKTSIHPISGALDKILALHGVEFNWKKDGRGDMGLVAQNVADVFPNVVSKDGDGMMAVEYDSLVGPMIEAIRTLKVENDDLRQKVAALDDMKAQVTQIRESLQALKQDNARLRSIKLDGSTAIEHSPTMAP